MTLPAHMADAAHMVHVVDTPHVVHTAMLLIPTALLLVWAGWAGLRSRSRRRPELPTSAQMAGLLSTGAGVVHLLVFRSHLAEDLLYGAFFAGAAVAQIGWACLVVARPGRAVLTAGLLGNVALLSLWATTRSVGVPLGVAAGRREPVGVLDLFCALLEVGVVAYCARTVLVGNARPSQREMRPAGLVP